MAEKRTTNSKNSGTVDKSKTSSSKKDSQVKDEFDGNSENAEVDMDSEVEGTSGSGDRKKNRFLRVLGIALICIVALLLVAVGAVYAVFMHYYNMTDYVTDDNVSTMAAEEAETYSDADEEEDEFYLRVEETDENGEVIGYTYETIDYDSLPDEEKESVDAQIEVELSLAADEQQEALDMVASGTLYLPDSVENETITVSKTTLEEEYEVEKDTDGNIVSVSKDGVTYEVVSDDGDTVVIKETVSDEDAIVTVDTTQKNDVYNILFIGADTRAGSSEGNADVIILISVNRTKGAISMISFMRDLYANIPGYGYDKINHAYRYGGAPLLVQTLEENYGVTVDNYALVDFYAMADIVDALGGLTLTLSADEVSVANTYIKQMCSGAGLVADDNYIQGSGTLQLNGIQTVAYCRIRYVGNYDFERTERHRKVLTAMFNKLKTMNISEINSFLNVALPYVTHNVSSATLIGLIADVPSYLGYELKSYRVPFDGYYTYSGTIKVPDFAYTISMLNSIIYY